MYALSYENGVWKEGWKEEESSCRVDMGELENGKEHKKGGYYACLVMEDIECPLFLLFHSRNTVDES